jgi:protein-S-isoprenylcysteine O-methyltransferase Ste14
MPGEFGNWGLVLASVLIFTVFSLGFIVPFKHRDWRSMGIYEAFLVALFTEMFGFPLTIYILTSFFGFNIPITLRGGHLFVSLLERAGFSHAYAAVHGVSVALILGGFAAIIWGWKKIFYSGDKLVKDGPYRYVRHPQYLGIYCIAVGLLLMWPTFLTLVMFPVLVGMYYRLARREEKDLEAKFGEEYLRYKKRTGMFLPIRKARGRI